jgi:hypothetical protein
VEHLRLQYSIVPSLPFLRSKVFLQCLQVPWSIVFGFRALIFMEHSLEQECVSDLI